MEDFNEFYEEPKVPTSIKVICIIELVFKGLSILFSSVLLVINNAFGSLAVNSVDASSYSTILIVAKLIGSIIVIIASTLILNRKKSGIVTYYVGYAVIFINSLVNCILSVPRIEKILSSQMIPFTYLGMVIGIIFILILPILMTIFVLKNKQYIGL